MVLILLLYFIGNRLKMSRYKQFALAYMCVVSEKHTSCLSTDAYDLRVWRCWGCCHFITLPTLKYYVVCTCRDHNLSQMMHFLRESIWWEGQWYVGNGCVALHHALWSVSILWWRSTRTFQENQSCWLQYSQVCDSFQCKGALRLMCLFSVNTAWGTSRCRRPPH